MTKIGRWNRLLDRNRLAESGDGLDVYLSLCSWARQWPPVCPRISSWQFLNTSGKLCQVSMLVVLNRFFFPLEPWITYITLQTAIMYYFTKSTDRKGYKHIRLVLSIYYFTLCKSTHNPKISHWPLVWERPLYTNDFIRKKTEKLYIQDCPLVAKRENSACRCYQQIVK